MEYPSLLTGAGATMGPFAAAPPDIPGVIEESACDHKGELNPRRTTPKPTCGNIFLITELQSYPGAGA
jgi:hypothetical protein